MIYHVMVAEPRNDTWASIASGVRRRQPEAAVLRVKDGEQAVRFLFQRSLLTEEPETPDLIVLAAELPIVPGNAIIARLRQHPRTRAVPVILMSPDACRGDDDFDDTLDSQQWLHRQPGIIVITGTHRLDQEVADAMNYLGADPDMSL